MSFTHRVYTQRNDILGIFDMIRYIMIIAKYSIVFYRFLLILVNVFIVRISCY